MHEKILLKESKFKKQMHANFINETYSAFTEETKELCVPVTISAQKFLLHRPGWQKAKARAGGSMEGLKKSLLLSCPSRNKNIVCGLTSGLAARKWRGEKVSDP